MLNIVLIIIAVICLAGILAIILKKMPHLASFDINSMPKEKEAETKKKIMDERLHRKTKEAVNKVTPFFQVIGNFAQRKFKMAHEKLKKIEESYKQQPQKEILTTKQEFESFEKKIGDSLKEAANLVEKEDFAEAEKKYIEIIGIDPKNVEAYRGLGTIYFQQKNYEEARQIFEHILKLNKLDDSVYAQLSQIAQQQGDYAKAKEEILESLKIKNAAIYFFELAEVCQKMEDYESAISNLEKALEIEPNNPKYLDLLITNCIINKEAAKASAALRMLKEANPDNQKIEEFKEQIKEL